MQQQSFTAAAKSTESLYQAKNKAAMLELAPLQLRFQAPGKKV